jgi:hypothetical protein
MNPYTYLVGWSKHEKYYYGVRYAVDCNPTDLWQTYFTSSSKVKQLRKVLGEPDVIQVRKTFNTREQARTWETKVLKKMKVILREDFLNEHDNPSPPINDRIMTQETKDKISAVHKGKPKSEEHKRKIREARAKQTNDRTGHKHTKEAKRKIREARAKQAPASEETRRKMSQCGRGMLWYNNGITETKSKTVIEGWSRGRLKQTKLNIRKGAKLSVLKQGVKNEI